MPIVGLPEATQLTYRAGVDGFWIALRMTTEPEPIELWHVGFDGSAARLGLYPSRPSPAPVGHDHTRELDAWGQLYQLVSQASPPTNFVSRRSVSGISEVVYTEAEPSPRVFRITGLVTGPGPIDDAAAAGRVWGGEISQPLCLATTDLWGYADTEPHRHRHSSRSAHPVLVLA